MPVAKKVTKKKVVKGIGWGDVDTFDRFVPPKTKCVVKKQKSSLGSNDGTSTQNSFGASGGIVISKKEDYEHEWESILLKDKKIVTQGGTLHYPLRTWQDGFDDGCVSGYESAACDFKRVNKITWILTAVNVAILINLIVK